MIVFNLHSLFPVSMDDSVLRNLPDDLTSFVKYATGKQQLQQLQSTSQHEEEQEQSTNRMNAQIIIWTQSEEDLLLSSFSNKSKDVTSSHLTFQRFKLFHEIFTNIDGNRLSFKDRNGINYKSLYQTTTVSSTILSPSHHHHTSSTLMLHHGSSSSSSFSASSATASISSSLLPFPSSSINGHLAPSASSAVNYLLSNNFIDDSTLSYNEIEFSDFDLLLTAVGCHDGQIFYDLGCGIGKVLIASILSGIRFLKVIGIEILPLLAKCSKEILNNLQLENETQSNTIHNSVVKKKKQKQKKKKQTGGINNHNSRKQQPSSSSDLSPSASPMKNDVLNVSRDLVVKDSESDDDEDDDDDSSLPSKPATPTWLRYDNSSSERKKKGKNRRSESDEEDDDSDNDDDLFQNESSIFTHHQILNESLEGNDNTSQTSQNSSYHIQIIPNLQQKLKQAKVFLPMIEVR
jgi:hypothetical protein